MSYMRDRLSISQIHELISETAESGATSSPNGDRSSSRRVRVPGKKNLTVIQSGQDWSTTFEEERRLYTKLDAAAASLQGNGLSPLPRRRFRVPPLPVQGGRRPHHGTGGGRDRTFALALFDELASLERWGKGHKTYLRLFHEVLVLELEQQVFEYVRCHRGTGMLGIL
ncbi:hypothetical protein LZ32DRAFT_379007 [Colletotrichum eremochloae]|nr:hypothetical protein LZ32DRAFT_379007 [Colletotrichum eremochloae]